MHIYLHNYNYDYDYIIEETYAVRFTQILENLGWTSIDEALKRRETLMTFKALTGRSPNYLTELFTTCENEPMLKPKRSFSYSAAKAWNELQCEINDGFRKSVSFISKMANEKRNNLSTDQWLYSNSVNYVCI